MPRHALRRDRTPARRAPGPARHRPLLAQDSLRSWQRALGNRAVGRLLGPPGFPLPLVQLKSTKDIIADFQRDVSTTRPASAPAHSRTFITSGQFYFTDRLLDSVLGRLAGALRGIPAGSAKAQAHSRFYGLMKTALGRDPAAFAQQRQAFLDWLASSSLAETGKRALTDVVGSEAEPAALERAARDFHRVGWNKIRAGVDPDLARLCRAQGLGFTLVSLMAVDLDARFRCGTPARRVSELYQKRRQRRPGARSTFGVALDFWTARGRRNMDRNVETLKAVLNAGTVVHARVLSPGGESKEREARRRYDRQRARTIPANHSIVIVGYDATNDHFVYWDPDASTTRLNVDGRDQQGFGTLEYDRGRKRLHAPGHEHVYLVTQTFRGR